MRALLTLLVLVSTTASALTLPPTDAVATPPAEKLSTDPIPLVANLGELPPPPAGKTRLPGLSALPAS